MKTLFLAFMVGFSIPAIAEKLSLQDFMSDATMLMADVSPNGKYIASLWNKEDFRIVRVFDMTGPKPKVVGVLGDNVVRPFKIAWANNDRILVSL